MEIEHSDYKYSKEDLDKAYSMGLECGAVVLKESIGLTCEAQEYMLEFLKKKILEDKVAAAMSSGKLNVCPKKPVNKSGVQLCKK